MIKTKGEKKYVHLRTQSKINAQNFDVLLHHLEIVLEDQIGEYLCERQNSFYRLQSITLINSLICLNNLWMEGEIFKGFEL